MDPPGRFSFGCCRGQNQPGRSVQKGAFPFARYRVAPTPSCSAIWSFRPRSSKLPFTLSPAGPKLLRHWGFRGLIATDALDMGAIAKHWASGRPP